MSTTDSSRFPYGSAGASKAGTRLAVAVVAAGLVLAGCSNPGSSAPPPANKSVETSHYSVYVESPVVAGRTVDCVVIRSSYNGGVALSCDWSAK